MSEAGSRGLLGRAFGSYIELLIVCTEVEVKGEQLRSCNN